MAFVTTAFVTGIPVNCRTPFLATTAAVQQTKAPRLPQRRRRVEPVKSLLTPLADDTVQALFSGFVSAPHLQVTTTIFLSALIQSLTGFGFAIVSVASLTNLPWIANSTLLQCVQPIAATLGAITAWSLLLPEIKLVKWNTLTPLLLSSTLLTPLGILLSGSDSDIMLRILGTVITAYVVYTQTGVKLPKFLASTPGAWLMGSVAGVFGGLFDITGPALVVYGDAKGWVEDFRRNILAVLSVNSLVVVIADLFTGRLEDYYYWDFVKCAFPGVLAGIVVGNQLSRHMNPDVFKRVVMFTCLVVGVKMMVF